MLHFDKRLRQDGGAYSADGLQDALSLGLVRRGQISRADARKAEALGSARDVALHDIYARHFGLSQWTLAAIMAENCGAQLVDPVQDAPDSGLVLRFGAAQALQDGLLPWRRAGDVTVILAASPDRFSARRTKLEALFGPVRLALTTQDQLDRCVSYLCGPQLAAAAENKVAPRESCRNWRVGKGQAIGAVICAILLAGAILAPHLLFAVLAGWAVLTLMLVSGLKAAAVVFGLRRDRRGDDGLVTPSQLPVITVLVPLFRETAIADHLLARLKRIDYPHALLDICLVLEADDITTRTTLGRTVLPAWMRTVVVPKGTIKTKPRALNYALDFARGSIIGIWDAEDAPDPQQLVKVARHFANAAPDVACLQGRLDYYNSSANWLTRCFTLEYASWFRVFLPGLQRMGLVLPLGGTTLFMRREALDIMGGWDAHNVTEDADLGVRLARYGYVTELLDSTTEEEANGRAWPWVKQRSRWLKGYVMTYGVHMRDPVQLWRDLGPWRFFGMQVLFLSTITQFTLSPLLWTFLLPTFGLPHPAQAYMSSQAFWMLAGFFVLTEIINASAVLLGLSKAGKLRLSGWVLTLPFYFPMACVAAYRGIFEIATRPFFWDKTVHGVLLPDDGKSPRYSAASTAAASSFRRVTKAFEI